jgi:hypothetical protein
MGLVKKCLPILGVILWFGGGQLRSQQTDPEEAYRLEYEQFMKIREIKEPLKRADELFAFVQLHPQSKLQNNAQQDYMYTIDEFRKAENWDLLLLQAQRFIKIRPRTGDTYYYLGVALNGQKKFDEAMDALARCYLLPNQGSPKAKTSLEVIWKARHAQKLDGLDAFMAKIRAELK